MLGNLRVVQQEINNGRQTWSSLPFLSVLVPGSGEGPLGSGSVLSPPGACVHTFFTRTCPPNTKRMNLKDDSLHFSNAERMLIYVLLIRKHKNLSQEDTFPSGLLQCLGERDALRLLFFRSQQGLLAVAVQWLLCSLRHLCDAGNWTRWFFGFIQQDLCVFRSGIGKATGESISPVLWECWGRSI